MDQIAIVDLQHPLPDLADELGNSFEQFGFAIVRNHSIPQELIERVDALQRRLFALSADTKRTYHVPGLGGARGYTPFGIETAKGALVQDLKEFWHIGRTLLPGHPYARYMAANVWPDELPGFRETMEAVFAAFEQTGDRVLRAIALHLGLAEDFFVDPVREGNSVMRLLHYPPLAADAPEGAVRAAAHGDINAITMLLGAEEAGLELLTRNGDWLALDPPAGALVVNIGDMLDRLTCSQLPSTMHRVVNPAGEAARRSRYSMPFFLHFRPDYLIDPLAECCSASASPPEPITAEDFLQQRLREIKLA